MDTFFPEKTVAVVGLGKIGLPLAAHYAEHGWTVIGCDINPAVIDIINRGGCHVDEEADLAERIAKIHAQGKISATTDLVSAAQKANVVVVIVPVIVHEDHSIAFESIDSATHLIGKGLQKNTLVVYETTLPVGTTSQRFRAILEEESHLSAETDFYLGYSPERVSSGHIERDLNKYPKVVGGINQRSKAAVEAFYGSVIDADLIVMESADEAEFVKLIETTYRDVNIALANEYAQFADAHGLRAVPSIAAANTQPYSHIHIPGVGVGGHCIPVYPYFLMYGDSEGLSLPRRSRVVNDDMSTYSAERVARVIGDLHGKKTLILGVAYRGDVKETAFTSAKLLREAFTQAGSEVFAQDPLFTDEELRARGYTPFDSSQAGSIDAIVIQAAHSEYNSFDFAQFTNCKVVLDGRASDRPERFAELGMKYITIGDGYTECASSLSSALARNLSSLLP